MSGLSPCVQIPIIKEGILLEERDRGADEKSDSIPRKYALTLVNIKFYQPY
jgi:hypothetical protein